MNRATQLFILNRFFFEAVILFLAGGFSFLLFTSRAAGFLYLSSYHNKFLDGFFIYYTNLGDGLFSIAIVLLLLVFRQFRLAWQILAAYIISGLFVQLLKGIIYSPRPKDFFKLKDHIHLFEGVTLNGNASFPSGHAASAFALATSLALFAINKKISLLYLMAAILVGYSRIYLAQHFPVDVMGGATIGVLAAIGVFFFFDRFKMRSRMSN
jgi:membrane-associated phospholipid phosphatase